MRALSRSPGRGGTVFRRRVPWPAVMGTLAMCLLSTAGAAACPFCTTLEPTLVQRREAAQFVVLAEVAASQDHAERRLVVRQLLKPTGDGAARFSEGDAKQPRDRALEPGATLAAIAQGAPGTLVLAFGESRTASPLLSEQAELAQAELAQPELAWTTVPVEERAIVYFVQGPPLSVPPSKRLSYFARFLEHADPVIAADAYAEFGYATFSDVEPVARQMDPARLRKYGYA